MQPVRRVLANPRLRRLQLSLAAVVLGGSAYQVALAVVAYERDGASGVGLAFFIQIFPVALITPFTSLVADRVDRALVMQTIDVLRCTCTGAVAIAVAKGGSLPLILALGAPGALASGAYAPASRALLPALVSAPDELTAANAVMSGVEHAAVLVGPAIAGALLAVADPAYAFAGGSALFLTSSFLVWRVGSVSQPASRRSDRPRWRKEATAGARLVAADPGLRVLVGLYAAQWLVAGALEVLAVVIARDALGLGGSGVGVLFSALGLGGLVGATLAVRLGGSRRLSATVAGGVLLWGVPLVLIGLSMHTATALIGLAVIGVATVLVDVSVVTLLQRAVDEEVLGRVFGVLETALIGMVGLGSLLAPLLREAVGTQTALVILGAVLPALVALAWPRLRRVDALDDETLERVALLRRLEIFAPLPAPVLESLAANLEVVDVRDGDVVIRQGERGDRFYVVADGLVDVRVDGLDVTTHGVGEGFGEIALLRDMPRTASVIGHGAARLLALGGDVFVSAVTGHAASAAAGDAVAAARLDRRRPLTAVTMS